MTRSGVGFRVLGSGAARCELRYYTAQPLVINFRKLAAIDIVFLGSTFVIAEFAAGVLLSAVLGVFVLVRSHSAGQLALGLYFLSLAANYVPMLLYAFPITRAQSARLEVGDELNNKRQAMAKYRRMSLLLLVPLFIPFMSFWLLGSALKSR